MPANDNGKLHNLQTDCATVRKTATKQLIKTHKYIFTVDKHVTIGNVTAKLPANVNEKLHNVQTDCATVRKTATKTLIKTHKYIFTVDKHVTIGNVTAKLPANVNGNCTMYKQAVQQ